MKIEWDADDICPGRRVMKPGTQEEECIISFDPRREKDDPKWAIVSLADGMLIRADCARNQIADYLNSNGSFPTEMIDPVTEKLRHRRANGPLP